MNASLLAQSAYSSASDTIRTPKSVEYDVFAKVTSALRRAVTMPDRAKALDDNLRLWVTLAADVASDGNKLPQQLRARIFYLYEFVSQHSQKMLRSKDDLSALVDVNTAIMAGLRQKADHL